MRSRGPLPLSTWVITLPAVLLFLLAGGCGLLADLEKEKLPEADVPDAGDTGDIDADAEPQPDFPDSPDAPDVLPDPDVPDDPGEDPVEETDDVTDIEADEAPEGCSFPITVNTGMGTVDLFYFQILVRIPFQDGMSADFSDLRFEEYGGLPLPFWIENKVDGDHAEVWVKFPIVEAGSDHEYLCRFGDPAAPGEGDPRAVFDLYEDFESGSLDDWVQIGGNVWSITTLEAHGGTHALTTGTVDYTERFLTHGTFLGYDITFESWAKLGVGIDCGFDVRASTTAPVDTYMFSPDEEYGIVFGKIVNGEWIQVWELGAFWPYYGEWAKVSVTILGSDLKVLVNDSLALPPSSYCDMGAGNATGSVGFMVYLTFSTGSALFDDARVRKASRDIPVYIIGTPTCD